MTKSSSVVAIFHAYLKFYTVVRFQQASGQTFPHPQSNSRKDFLLPNASHVFRGTMVATATVPSSVRLAGRGGGLQSGW